MSLNSKPAGIKATRMDRIVGWIINLILILMSICALYPIYFVIIASFSDPFAVARGEVLFLPKGINLSAYQKLWGDTRIWIGYRNSLFYTIFGTILSLICTLPAGYALSRPKLFLRRPLSLFFVFTMYFSGGTVPSYIVLRNMGMINSIWAILLPNVVTVFNLIIVRSFFEGSIPEALYEAAFIDGCSHFRFFASVVIPLSPAIIAVMALYYGLALWNAYFEPMIYVSNEKIQTLQVIMKSVTATPDYSTAENVSAEMLVELIRTKALVKYAIVVVASVPMLLLYPFVQRFFIQGVMVGAVKG